MTYLISLQKTGIGIFNMAIHNKSHSNSGLMQLNKMKRNNIKHKSALDFIIPEKTNCILLCDDCLNTLKAIPDGSIQLILIDILNGRQSGLMNHIEFSPRMGIW